MRRETPMTKRPTMQSPTKENNIPNYHDMEVSSIAYQLWQTAGRPTGRYMQFWMEAEERVLAERKALLAKRSAKMQSRPPGPNGQPAGGWLKFDAKKESGEPQPPPSNDK